MNPFRERLSPAWWLIGALGLLLPGSLLVFLPLSILVGIAVGLGLWWGCVAVLWFFSPVLKVTHQRFSAGAASVEMAYIKRVELFRDDGARGERGTGLDARAWLVIRPWIDPVVKITLSDPLDPTPYWLVSSARPQALVDAIRAAQSG